MTMNFEYFQIQKWIQKQTVREEKVDEKNGVICLVPIFPSWVKVLKLSKKCIFNNFVLSSTRSQSLLKEKNLHICIWEVSLLLFQRVVLFIVLWRTVSEILGFEVEEFCLISAESVPFWYFNSYIPWTIAQTPLNHIIFWNCVMRTFGCTYLNYLDFLLRSAQDRKKHFFGEFKEQNSGTEHEN